VGGAIVAKIVENFPFMGARLGLKLRLAIGFSQRENCYQKSPA
jgi:hypothetical protein